MSLLFIKKPGENAFLALTALGAFCLGMIVLLPQNFIGDDGVYYARVALNIAAGKGICANVGQVYLNHPPFFPFLMVLFNFVLRDIEFTGHVTAILFYALAVIPLFKLTAAAYSDRTAYLFSCLYITQGFLLINAPSVMADMTFSFLIYAGLWVLFPLLAGTSRSFWRAAVWGALMGCSALTRTEGVFFFLVLAAALPFLFHRQINFRKSFLFLFLAVSVFSAFYVPYAGYLKAHLPSFQLSRATTLILIRRQMDIRPNLGYIEAKKIYFGLTADKKRFKIDELIEEFDFKTNLTRDNYALVRSAFSAIVPRFYLLQKYWYMGLGSVLALCAFFYFPWTIQRTKVEILFFLCLTTLGLKLVSIFLPRYFLTYFPIFLIWTAAGIEALRQRLGGFFRLPDNRSMKWALGFCLLLALPSAGYLYRTLSQYPPPLEYKALGSWMTTHLPAIEEQTVLSRQPSVNFYSGARDLKLPYVDDFEDLKTFMRHQKAGYFVVASDLERPLKEAYESFLDETQPPPEGFSRLHMVQGNIKVILYGLRQG